MPAERKFLPTVIRLAVVLVPLLGRLAVLGVLPQSCFVGCSDQSRDCGSVVNIVINVPTDCSHRFVWREELSNAQSAIMFSIAPLTSLSAMTTPVDPDPVASFRQLIALPPDTAREAPHIDPRRMRTIVDRGVVGYASAKTDGERAKGARLIQTAALVGYPPARDLLARNYPQSEAVRSVVPANDVIRYALGPLMEVAATSEDLKQIFLALGQHFALHGQLDLFAAQILNSMRGDSRPQLGYRIDTLLDLLARVPGACGALARLVPGAGEAADQECSFRENLRKYIETRRGVGSCGGGRVKAPRFVDVKSARRTLARRRLTQ